MKKTLALLLALVLMLSLCACGGEKVEETTNQQTAQKTDETQANDVLDKNDTSNYYGIWETEHWCLDLKKGGVGRYEPTYDRSGYYDMEWEVKDEVLVVRFSGFGGMEFKAVLELNDDASALIVIQEGFPAYVEGEKVFHKVV